MDGVIRQLAVPLFLLVLLALVHPACVAGQSWVAEAYWTNLDEQPPWGVGSEPADPVPTGFGVGIRHLIDSHLFVEAQVSRGADQRLGAICGGLVGPGDCVLEPVKYSGGAVALSLGWRLSKPFARVWSAVLAPRTGVGLLWAAEDGRDTGKSFSQKRLAGQVGVAAELARLFPATGLALGLTSAVSLFKPTATTCEDCRIIFDSSVLQLTLGVSIGW